MRKGFIALTLLSILCLAGCGEGKNESLLCVEKDGTVKSYIVEDFTASYYNADELKESVTQDILSFNEDYDNAAVELTNFEAGEGILRATIEYQSAEAYEEFNEEAMSFGLLAEVSEKYDIDADFYDVKNMENKLDFSDITDENYNIMIFTEPVSVKVPGKVLYISDGLQKGNSSKSVTVTDDKEEIYYIVYE